MSKTSPPDARGLPWPFEGKLITPFREIGSDANSVLIEDLSNHYFLLRGTGCSVDTESQVNILSQEDTQTAADEPTSDCNYPLDTHRIEQASAPTLDSSAWPWMNAQEVLPCEYSDFDISEEYSLEVNFSRSSPVLY